jgi:hypothetical protein
VDLARGRASSREPLKFSMDRRQYCVPGGQQPATHIVQAFALESNQGGLGDA